MQTQRESACSPSKGWSGKRVSNSRPQPWQGCALPTELFPRAIATNYISSHMGVKKCTSARRVSYASSEHFRDRIGHVVHIARVERGDADPAGVDRVDGKILTQARHLVGSESR